MNLVPPCKIRPLMKSFSSDVSETLPKNNAPFQNENWLPYQLTPSPYSDVCICSDLSTMRLLDFPSLHFPTRKSTLQIQAYNYEFNPRESSVNCWKLYRVFQIGRGGFLTKKKELIVIASLLRENENFSGGKMNLLFVQSFKLGRVSLPPIFSNSLSFSGWSSCPWSFSSCSWWWWWSPWWWSCPGWSALVKAIRKRKRVTNSMTLTIWQTTHDYGQCCQRKI